MPGLDRLLRGILEYRRVLQPVMLKQFQKVRDNPDPKAVMFSCIDSRVLMTRLLQSNVGDMLYVRNAGNLIPNNDGFSFNSATTEPGALELGCITNNSRHVIVCGHSDCKAMNLLYSVRDTVYEQTGTPLQMWLKRHGVKTVEKYKALLKAGGSGPLDFQGETPSKHFEAYIDSEKKFQDVDRFSQVNALQQIENIASYPMLFEKLQNNKLRVHVLWFDVYTGEFYMFCREQNHFIQVTEDTYDALVIDATFRT